MADKQKTVLMILDGFGLSDDTEGNAIYTAKTPNIDRLMKNYPFQKGKASGMDVGLPRGQMGNSEVGHTNIGAGRVVYQSLTLITKDIEDGTFFKNETLQGAVKNCADNKSALHLYGLIGDGGVHSHDTHLFALLELAKRGRISEVYVHAFMDGRDTPPTSGLGYIKKLEEEMRNIGVGKIATVSGRYYAMDREAHWDRTKLAYDALTLGVGEKYANSAESCLSDSYASGVNDEFVLPTVILADGKLTGIIKKNDSIIFFNFRPDRARQLTCAFCENEFNGFERANDLFPVYYACFTDYDQTIKNKRVVFDASFFNQNMDNTLGQYVSALGLSQLRLAETTKYAHVTYFFNGGIEEPYTNEERILVPSPEVATYDLKPEMSAYGIAEKLEEAVKSKKFDLIIVNFANCDMVGHTGIMPAAVKAVEAVDECVGRAMDALLEVNGQMFLCADHGNSDKMIDRETGEPFTAHTTNPVPFIIFNCEKAAGIKEGGKLCDISPTLLDMMGIPQPKEMTGRSLLIHK